MSRHRRTTDRRARRTPFTGVWRAGVFVLGVWALLPFGDLAAQPGFNEPIINKYGQLDIIEHLDTQVDLDLTFMAESGEPVALSKYFDGERPVVLNLAYFACPMLCNLVVEGMMEAVDQIDWTMGDEFTVLTVSIDPREKPSTARARKELLVEEMGRQDAIDGWPLLTGEEKNIRALADSVGFQYAWDDDRAEYAHGAVLILLTPDGRVSRYLYGIKFDPKVLRLSLVEAGDGKVGSAMDKIMLLCFMYDPESMTYGIRLAWIMMRLGAVVTIAALLFLWIQAARRRQNGIALSAVDGPALSVGAGSVADAGNSEPRNGAGK